MSDLFGNHIVGFPTRRLILCTSVKSALSRLYSNEGNPNFLSLSKFQDTVDLQGSAMMKHDLVLIVWLHEDPG